LEILSLQYYHDCDSGLWSELGDDSKRVWALAKHKLKISEAFDLQFLQVTYTPDFHFFYCKWCNFIKVLFIHQLMHLWVVLKNNIKIYIKTAPTCFGVIVTPSSDSVYCRTVQHTDTNKDLICAATSPPMYFNRLF